MLTDAFYVTLAAGLKPAAGGAPTLYMAIGAGDPAWDRNPPLSTPGVVTLFNELARQPIAPDDVQFIGEDGKETAVPSARLRIRSQFEPGNGSGTLREAGLFSFAASERNSGTLLSYFVHPPIEKSAEMRLERTISIDLTPRGAGGIVPTRYLGNSRTREVHDLENRTSACQVDEILFDRRVYFGSAEQAIELGYDYCARCFGRGRSTR